MKISEEIEIKPYEDIPISKILTDNLVKTKEFKEKYEVCKTCGNIVKTLNGTYLPHTIEGNEITSKEFSLHDAQCPANEKSTYNPYYQIGRPYIRYN